MLCIKLLSKKDLPLKSGGARSLLIVPLIKANLDLKHVLSTSFVFLSSDWVVNKNIISGSRVLTFKT